MPRKKLTTPDLVRKSKTKRPHYEEVTDEAIDEVAPGDFEELDDDSREQEAASEPAANEDGDGESPETQLLGISALFDGADGVVAPDELLEGDPSGNEGCLPLRETKVPVNESRSYRFLDRRGAAVYVHRLEGGVVRRCSRNECRLCKAGKRAKRQILFLVLDLFDTRVAVLVVSCPPEGIEPGPRSLQTCVSSVLRLPDLPDRMVEVHHLSIFDFEVEHGAAPPLTAAHERALERFDRVCQRPGFDLRDLYRPLDDEALADVEDELTNRSKYTFRT